jgi:hypothetical protein
MNETELIDKVGKMEDYSIRMPAGDIFKICRICGKKTISFPLQIIHKDGKSLCSQCSEKIVPALHEALHFYLDKYRHNLRKLKTEKNQLYTFEFAFSKKIEGIKEVDFLLSDLATTLCHLADLHEGSSTRFETDGCGCGP